MSDTLRDKAARAAKALDRTRDPETFEREFLRDHPTYAEEYHRLKRSGFKVASKAGPTPTPATQPDLIERSAEEKRRKRRRR